MADGVFDTKKHTNVKRRAEYRRINKYYKGLEKIKAEKARRRLVLELQDQGLTIRQVAMRLGVSERTVKRDLARLEPYVKKKMTQLRRQADGELADWFVGLSLNQQLSIVRKRLRVQGRAPRLRRCKSLNVTICLDSVFAGRYGVRFKPDLPVNVAENGRITFELEVGGQKQAVARIYVGKLVSDALFFSTNQSMNSCVFPVLKGFKVVSPSLQ